jgi:hypothetical protein
VTSAGPQGSQGWSLFDVIARAEPDHVPHVVQVIGEASKFEIRIPVRTPPPFYVLRANQRGEYVFRVWESGARTPTHEVRKVTMITLD